LTKATGICAALFFITSMTLAVMAEGTRPASITDHLDKITVSKELPSSDEVKPATGQEAESKKTDKAPSVPVAE
jgi:preprotein translocase subunit SecG